MQEKENILKILQETRNSIENEDTPTLKELSNQTIHTASLAQDPDNIAIAVIIYSLGKILERKDYKLKPGWEKFYKNFTLELDSAIQSLKKDDENSLRKNIENLRQKITNRSGNLKKYIQEVFRKASVNKASRIYEHGISLEKTAKLLGITMWELSNYAGQTGIADVKFSRTLGVKERIKLAEEMFT